MRASGRHRSVLRDRGDGVACSFAPNGLIRPWALAEEWRSRSCERFVPSGSPHARAAMGSVLFLSPSLRMPKKYVATRHLGRRVLRAAFTSGLGDPLAPNARRGREVMRRMRRPHHRPGGGHRACLDRQASRRAPAPTRTARRRLSSTGNPRDTSPQGPPLPNDPRTAHRRPASLESSALNHHAMPRPPSERRGAIWDYSRQRLDPLGVRCSSNSTSANARIARGAPMHRSMPARRSHGKNRVHHTSTRPRTKGLSALADRRESISHG